MLNDLVKGLLSELAKVSNTDSVVGEVRDAGRAKVVPLCKVTVGFGTVAGEVGGSAGEDGKGGAFDAGAAAGAFTIEPQAFVVVGEDGIPHMLAVKKGKEAVLRKGVSLIQLENKGLPSGTPAEKATTKALPEGGKQVGAQPASKTETAAKKKSEV
jgi:uncharacterized spore protein YtfJ